MLCGLGKFRKHLPVLTTRHLLLRIWGKVYEACVHRAMLHGSETWGPNNLELQRLHRYDHIIFLWICGIKDRGERPSASLLQKLGIQDIMVLADQMAWPCTTAHVLYQIYHKLSDSQKGRPRKTWSCCALVVRQM